MKVELKQVPLLTPAEIGETASALDTLHSRVLKTIERLQKDVDARKAAIANRWKALDGVTMTERARFSERETLSVIREIQDKSRAELDNLLKDAGPAHAKLMGQRLYYDAPTQVLARVGLGDPRRTAYLQQLAYAGPAELAHFAQVAVGTKDEVLAAAVLSMLDKMPSKDRPVGPATFAEAMNIEGYVKVQEYIKIGDARLQGIVLAIRTWTQGKSNPINTVALALRQRELDPDVVKELRGPRNGA